MTTPYQNLIDEGDRNLESAQALLRTAHPDQAAGFAATASALYARAGLEKPDAAGALLALMAAKAQQEQATTVVAGGPNPVDQSMQRHPAGSQRASMDNHVRGVSPEDVG